MHADNQGEVPDPQSVTMKDVIFMRRFCAQAPPMRRFCAIGAEKRAASRVQGNVAT